MSYRGYELRLMDCLFSRLSIALVITKDGQKLCVRVCVWLQFDQDELDHIG